MASHRHHKPGTTASSALHDLVLAGAGLRLACVILGAVALWCALYLVIG